MLASLTAFDEKLLLTRLKEGDNHAFEQVYRLYANRLLGNIINLVKSEAIAAELMQEVFVKVWFNRDQIDAERPFSPYVFRIARNLVVDFFRKAARDSKLKLELAANSSAAYMHIEEDMSEAEAFRCLHQLIGNLPAKRRTIFQMIKLDGLSYAEVSNQLNISESTINDHIVKATKQIQRQMQQLYPGAITLPVIFLLA